MAKKTSPVDKTVKKKPSKGTGVKKKPSGSSSLRQELAQRNAELAVINSIQQGLASKLDFNGIFELVGEKLHEIFPRFDITYNGS